jgi:hypothetical protein
MIKYQEKKTGRKYFVESLEVNDLGLIVLIPVRGAEGIAVTPESLEKRFKKCDQK